MYSLVTVGSKNRNGRREIEGNEKGGWGVVLVDGKKERGEMVEEEEGQRGQKGKEEREYKEEMRRKGIWRCMTICTCPILIVNLPPE